ncbi:short-chain dehydrogenase [Nocardioides gansuensis]|uniref:Short-chain dehydrogenase n=1 Tax=Nocardioides gansuensis TaxID=2138300 RepID=A0A2T8FF19_9ACTN|nr:oxidoreductase [Nocardioides gansuensis]PVG84289.1 short-chain dehydrogenase [Nocardioides gansuensis]
MSGGQRPEGQGPDGQQPWTLADIPDQTGRTIVVTGPSLGGIGYHTALELTRKGARVVLAGRSEEKLAAADAAIRKEVHDAALEHLVVDLADLSSVRRAGAAAVVLGRIDVLVNNAGIMATPHRLTVDGLESQMATNHFGPFLLTGLLLPQLVATDDGSKEGSREERREGRVVTVSSLMHRAARQAPLHDPRSRRRYQRWPAYGESKLANLLFTYELDRRARDAGLPLKALAAHPGLSGTHLTVNGMFAHSHLGEAPRRPAAILDAAVKAVSQSAAAGAWPSLMAATADLPGSTYVGPSGRGELRGPPMIVSSRRLSHDREAQRRLWEISEETVGLSYP